MRGIKEGKACLRFGLLLFPFTFSGKKKEAFFGSMDGPSIQLPYIDSSSPEWDGLMCSRDGKLALPLGCSYPPYEMDFALHLLRPFAVVAHGGPSDALRLRLPGSFLR